MNEFVRQEICERNRWVRFGKRTHRRGFFGGVRLPRKRHLRYFCTLCSGKRTQVRGSALGLIAAKTSSRVKMGVNHGGRTDSCWHGRLELSGLGERRVPAGQGGGPTSYRCAVPRLRGGRQFLLSSTGGAHGGKLGPDAGATTRVPLFGKGMAAFHA